MGILPKIDKIVIPPEKFLSYALDYNRDPDKAFAFEAALGYTKDNAVALIDNIKKNLHKFPARQKGDNGHGMLYEVVLTLVGPNGKSAKVLTGWMDDLNKDEMRLITAHIDN